MTWNPGDPWPGTPGGTSSPWWGPRMRLYVHVSLAPGVSWRLGPGPSCRLDSGFVMGPLLNAPTVPATPGLWVDLTCATVSVSADAKASRSDGAVARTDASMVTVTLLDPDRRFDPMNPNSPWTLNGTSRLMPGVPVHVFAESVDTATPPVVSTHHVFTGTADSWNEPWTPNPNARRCKLVASDPVKDLANRDWGEQPAVGAGDTVNQRITRILSYYNCTGPTSLDSSAVTLQSTTLAQSAWELLLRATDDEIGFTFFLSDGRLRFINRDSWSTPSAPAIVIGCPGATYDIVTAASVGNNAIDIRNSISAARTGGTAQRAISQASIDKFGVHGYGRTDLGLQSDAQAATWATFTLSQRAFPRANVQTIDLAPALNPASWPKVLDLRRAVDTVRLLWTPPGSTDAYDVTGRVLGMSHEITRTRWEVAWDLGMASVSRKTFHVGAHAFDKLNDGNVMA